jgi:hypothetical protein
MWWEQNCTTVDHLNVALHSYGCCCLMLKVCTDQLICCEQRWSWYLDVRRMHDMMLTILLQCAHLVISCVGLVRRDQAVLARADGGAAVGLAWQWPRVPPPRGGRIGRPGDQLLMSLSGARSGGGLQDKGEEGDGLATPEPASLRETAAEPKTPPHKVPFSPDLLCSSPWLIKFQICSALR